jgi:hypothetical protein
MNNRIKFSIKFSELLNHYLIKKYKKKPSANFVANQFNLRSNGTTTITAETARKWMTGMAVPKIDRFIVLIHWLEFDPGQMFGIDVQLNGNEKVNELIKKLEQQLNLINTTIDDYKK